MKRRSLLVASLTIISLGCWLPEFSTFGQQPTCTAPPANMVAWWPADGNYKDIIGGHTGSAVGSVPFASGEVSQAFSFSGPGSGYVNIPGSGGLNISGRLTLDAWIQLANTAAGTQYYIIQKGPVGSCAGALFTYQLLVDGLSTNNTVEFAIGDGTNVYELHSNTQLAVGTWYHVAAEYDGSSQIIYINGAQDAVANIGSKALYTNPSDPVQIGYSNGACGVAYFDGLIDEVELFNRALAASEIQAIYNAGSAGKCKGALLTPATLAFGTVLIGTTSPSKTVTLRNIGTSTLDIFSIETAGEFGQSNTCTGSLAPGARCVIDVSFTPTVKGSETSQLLVSDSTPDSPQIVSLSGAGTYVELTPANLGFGNQPVGTTSAPQNVTLTNTSSLALSIAGISLKGTNAGDFAETNTCGTSVAAGNTCTITVTFTPTAKGARSASVSVSDNGGASPQKVALTGSGT